MPIYAFECDACGHEFETLQRLADADPTVCPVCGVQRVRRQLTAPSFRLAGAGWYETDFKKDGDKKRNLVDKTEPAPSTASDKPATPASGKGDAASPAPAVKPAKTETAPTAKPAAKAPD